MGHRECSRYGHNDGRHQANCQRELWLGGIMMESVVIREVRLHNFTDIPSLTYIWSCRTSNEGRLRRIIPRKLGKNNVMRLEK